MLREFKSVCDRYPYYWNYSKVWKQHALPNLPLYEVAQKWNIRVTCIPASRDTSDCLYLSWKNQIILTSTEEIVFFNALSKVALEKLEYDCLKPCEQEIIAELSAQALHRMVGTKQYPCFGNSYGIIERYADMLNQTTVSAVRKYLPHAERVITLILSQRR